MNLLDGIDYHIRDAQHVANTEGNQQYRPHSLKCGAKAYKSIIRACEDRSGIVNITNLDGLFGLTIEVNKHMPENKIAVRDSQGNIIRVFNIGED